MSFANSPANDTMDFLFGIRWYDNWYDDYDKKKYKSYQIFHSIPVLSGIIDNSISDAKSDLYLNRYGMDYNDIIDPSKMYNAYNGSREFGSVNWIGRNIGRLYR